MHLSAKKQFVLWYILGALFVGVFLLPVLRLQWFAEPLFRSTSAQTAMTAALIALCPLAALWAFAGEPLGRKGRWAAMLLVLVATAICEVVHYWVIDRGHYFAPSQFADNTVWQEFMHNPIISLHWTALPHSYRFMPDTIVHVFKWLCGDFAIARIAYRLIFNALLFVAIYRYARTYVSELLAGGAVAIVVAVYPITILKYAGQFVDPMANCCFIAALACLARGYEPGFGPIVFAGLFAKESVIVAALCRLFYGANRWRALLATIGYVAIGAAILIKIRKVVMIGDQGHTGMKAISGVDWKHIPDNLAGYKEWILMYVAAFAAVVPGTILGWRYMDRRFQLTAAVVIVSTLVSTLVFSWMSEMRNLMPAFVVMAIVNAAYLERTLVPRAAADLAAGTPGVKGKLALASPAPQPAADRA